MATETPKRGLQCDPDIAAQLERLIDASEFATVKRYARSPDTEINQVLIVHPSYHLHEVGAAAVTGERECWNRLLERGAIVYAVDELPDGGQRSVLLDNYPDTRRCHVLYLPPAYPVQFAAFIDATDHARSTPTRPKVTLSQQCAIPSQTVFKPMSFLLFFSRRQGETYAHAD